MHKTYLEGKIKPSFKRILSAFLTICVIQIVVFKTSPDSLEKQLQTPIAMGLVIPATAIAGFTLAEVLISLTVVGVVASLTIPNLVKDTNDKKYRAAFKKKYSEINSMITMIKLDNGGSLENICPGCGAEGASNAILQEFKKQTKYIKACGYDTAGCWFSGGRPKELGPNADSDHVMTTPVSIILNDGSTMRMHFKDNCNVLTGDTFNRCGQIEIDVNGAKGPNQWGKDVYGMWVTKDQIYPYGSTDYSWGKLDKDLLFKSCVTSSEPNYNSVYNAGYSCAAKVLRNIDY